MSNENEQKPMYSQAHEVDELWREYYPRLKIAVSRYVSAIRQPVANESEIALSAFQSFISRANEGKFDDLNSEDEVWKLLKTIAVRKANDIRKKLKAKKRGGGQYIYGQSDLTSEDGQTGGITSAAGPSNSPSVDLEVSELFNQLMDRLTDQREKDVILLKLQGASVAIIADSLNIGMRTVQRVLKRIEEEWNRELLDQ